MYGGKLMDPAAIIALLANILIAALFFYIKTLKEDFIRISVKVDEVKEWNVDRHLKLEREVGAQEERIKAAHKRLDNLGEAQCS